MILPAVQVIFSLPPWIETCREGVCRGCSFGILTSVSQLRWGRVSRILDILSKGGGDEWQNWCSPTHLPHWQHGRKQTWPYLCNWVLHHKHIGDVAKPSKILAKLLLTVLPAEPPNKELAGSRVGGGGGASRGLTLAPQLPGAGVGGGEGETGQLIHGQPGRGRCESGW